MFSLLASLVLAQEIRADRLKADIAFLASPALEGRLSMARGAEVTAEWLASEYAKIGLRPVQGESFLQPVPLIEYRTDREATCLAAKEKKWCVGQGIGGGFPEDVRLEGEVVFAGFGVHAPALGYDDYAGFDVRGKIVLVFDHEPQETDPQSVFNGLGNTIHANTRKKAMVAQERGALALLVVAEPNRKHPSSEDRRKRTNGPSAGQKIASQVREDNEVRIPVFTLDDAVAKELAGGFDLAAAQTAIDRDLRPQSRALGFPATLRNANRERRRGVSHNVVGMIPGTDKAEETILYSGHYDHDGIVDGKLYPGADDNASGTAGVLELARAFMAAKEKPRRTIVFACWTGEERGLLGAYHYAAHPPRPLPGTRAVINFDMIGRDEKPTAQTDGVLEIAPDTSNEVGLGGSVYSPDLRDAVETANRGVGLRLTSKWDQDHALNVFQRSDQFPFALQGVPAFWWFTGFHPDYHQPTDTVEKINFPKMVKILTLAYRTGLAVANQDGHPRFVTDPKPRPRP